MDYKEFFLTDNKSGWKTRENLLLKNEPKIYEELKKFINLNSLNELAFKQQVWHFINNDSEIKKCLTCGIEVGFKDTLTKGYRSFCSLKCTNENPITQIRATNQIEKKYGVKYFPQHDTFIDKVKETKLNRYSDENYNNMNKNLETKELIYGDKDYNNKLKNKKTTRNNFLNRLKLTIKDEVIKYDLNDDNLTLKCLECNNEYKIYNNLLNSRINVNIKPCTICNPIRETNSIQEKELFEFVSSILPNVEVLNKDRSLIRNFKPLELDIYIPSYKLAIEFNGLYWHSDKFESSEHLLNKTKLCETERVSLLHVFEDEWIYKREIVQSIIKSRLGLSDTKIYGRKTIIKEVSPTEAKLFLDNNHIQGNVNAKIKLGLYYNYELVSLMTFGGLRISMGSKIKEDDSYELYRFVNKLNTSVIGGFSKLLKHFISEYNPKNIITFSDNRYFNGGVYTLNGFNYLYDSKPNYFYINNHKREYRFKYRKDVLVSEGYDINKTEKEIMFERGFNRIYDCGNKKYILNLR